ncbi:uncharacterized protein PAC_03896 [Phialocephala subalpina]|uniref:Uncharacterized protein n=1 Tax=Phialocephala subalpina TaxID=576137 RepID=A0A1L7WMM3_9HELO|nr:uncharacterized protein PAC_03896 [Phialocephala subalpina]
MPPIDSNSSHSFAQQSTSPKSDIRVPQSQVKPEVAFTEHVEDVRNREDYSTQLESDAPTQPRVNLPSQDNYGTTTTEKNREDYLEDGEIDDVNINRLDGTDMGEMDLDDLLELEEDEADDIDVYGQLDSVLPKDLVYQSCDKIRESGPQRAAEAGGLRTSPLFSQATPTYPPGLSPPDPWVERLDVWLTGPEYLLYEHPQLKKWRVKRPSRLRTCWMLKVEESNGEDERAVL